MLVTVPLTTCTSRLAASYVKVRVPSLNRLPLASQVHATPSCASGAFPTYTGSMTTEVTTRVTMIKTLIARVILIWLGHPSIA